MLPSTLTIVAAIFFMLGASFGLASVLDRWFERTRRAALSRRPTIKVDRVAPAVAQAHVYQSARPTLTQPYCPRCFAHYRATLPHLLFPECGTPGLPCELHVVSPALAALIPDAHEIIAEACRPEGADGAAAAVGDRLERAGWTRLYALTEVDGECHAALN